MWKYVSRRIKDTFERSANHFDRRSATVVNNSSGLSENKNKRSDAPCRWFCPRECWNSSGNDGGTNSKKWNFDQLNRSWIGAITWSSALVVGWYTSQLLNLKYKHSHKGNQRYSPSNIFSFLHPYIDNVDKKSISSISKFEKIASTFTPTVYLISNDSNEEKSEIKAGSSTDSTTNPDLSSSDDDLGNVLNSIENRLGLAAIENGQHKDGLNLLRSAANRNHAPALYNLGICYEMGLGVAVNEKTAMELYKSAAALEHPGALYNLGIYYGQGRGGLNRDVKTATRLLRLAAVQGQQDAINALKTLEPEIPVSHDGDSNSWFNYSPYAGPESVIPVQTTLFVENVNYQHSRNDARVY